MSPDRPPWERRLIWQMQAERYADWMFWASVVLTCLFAVWVLVALIWRY